MSLRKVAIGIGLLALGIWCGLALSRLQQTSPGSITKESGKPSYWFLLSQVSVLDCYIEIIDIGQEIVFGKYINLKDSTLSVLNVKMTFYFHQLDESPDKIHLLIDFAKSPNSRFEVHRNDRLIAEGILDSNNVRGEVKNVAGMYLEDFADSRLLYSQLNILASISKKGKEGPASSELVEFVMFPDLEGDGNPTEERVALKGRIGDSPPNLMMVPEPCHMNTFIMEYFTNTTWRIHNQFIL